MKYAKRITMLLTIIGLLTIGGNASASSPVHSVTGSASVAEEGLSFRTTIAAFKWDDGQTSGIVVLNIDLTSFGLGMITFQGRAVCLHVDGANAWVGAVVTHSTDPEIVPVGAHTITLVRDIGGNGQDIMHTEFFDPSVDCSTQPAVPETVVTNGNYSVR